MPGVSGDYLVRERKDKGIELVTYEDSAKSYGKGRTNDPLPHVCPPGGEPKSGNSNKGHPAEHRADHQETIGPDRVDLMLK